MIRQIIHKLKISDLVTNEKIVDEMLAYYQRREDHEQVRTSIKKRYGRGIKIVTDPNNPDVRIETYVHEDFEIQVNSGMIEALSIGFGPKVVGATASLFTEPGQRFTLTHETIDDTTDAGELLDRHRKEGGYKAALTKTDRRSVQVGSAAVMVSFVIDSLSYQTLSPSDVRAFFAETIEDVNGPRATDVKDLEDASVVIIRLSKADVVTWNYLAIFGRSDEYPNGRYVQYQDTDASTAVPEPNTLGVIEYEIDGQIANPLSYWANERPDENIPEYPIAIIDGGVTEGTDAMPVTTSLYEDCKEVDTAGSHLLSTSQSAARGTRALEQSAEAANQPLPRTLDGDIALQPGQKVVAISNGASDSVEAMEVLKDLMVTLALGYAVPDYMVMPDDHTIEASSGIALQVKTRPLKKQRELRIEINQPAVKKIFEIEKALIGFYTKESVPGVAVLLECEQTWDAASFRLPENRKEASERIIALLDKGILDLVAAIREYYQLPTDEEAMVIYDKMKDRAAEYPPLVSEQKEVSNFDDQDEFQGGTE